MAMAKKAVFESTPDRRCSSRPPSTPTTSATPTLRITQWAYCSSWAVTAGVKFRPRARPMIHWPPLRIGCGRRRGAPAMRRPATASSGPIIHGRGVCR